MSSIIKVDTVQDQDGNNIINENANTITIGASGDTITIPSGATFDSSAATNTLPSTVVTTTGTQTLTNKSIVASQLTGTVATSNLGTGTADATTFLRGDQTYAEAGGGKLLQVISTTITSVQTTTSTSFTDVPGLTLSITPSSSSNKVLIIFSGASVGNDSTAYDTKFTIVRDSTNLGSSTNGFGVIRATGNHYFFASANYLDSPSTTSATTYKIQFVADPGSIATIGKNDAHSTITAMEIAG